MAGLEKSPSWAGAFHTFNDHRVAVGADWRDGELPAHGWSNSMGRSCGVTVTPHAAIWTRTDHGQIWRRTDHTGLNLQSCYIAASNPRRELCSLTLPSQYNAGGGRGPGPCMMYPKEYKNIVSWKKRMLHQLGSSALSCWQLNLYMLLYR